MTISEIKILFNVSGISRVKAIELLRRHCDYTDSEANSIIEIWLQKSQK